MRGDKIGNGNRPFHDTHGISEMRIFVGSGYRVYYTRRAEVVYLLLCGGNKSSQKRDIKLAKSILDEIEKED